MSNRLSVSGSSAAAAAALPRFPASLLRLVLSHLSPGDGDGCGGGGVGLTGSEGSPRVVQATSGKLNLVGGRAHMSRADTPTMWRSAESRATLTVWESNCRGESFFSQTNKARRHRRRRRRRCHRRRRALDRCDRSDAWSFTREVGRRSN